MVCEGEVKSLDDHWVWDNGKINIVVGGIDEVLLRFTFFFAFLISTRPTLLANAFPSHDDYYSLPLLSRWSS